MVLLLYLEQIAYPQTPPPCSPGWNGQVLIYGDEDPRNWMVEADNGSSGTIDIVPGFIGNAVQFNWNLGTGNWVQIKYTFPQPIELSQKDIFGVSLRGSTGIKNRISIMFADTNGVFFGMDCDGINTISRWMKNLPLSKKLFYYFFTIGPSPNLKKIDWTQINRFFIVVKRPGSGQGGGIGQLTIDHLQADRAADWPRQMQFERVRSDTAAVAKAVRYILNQQKATGLFVSWKEEKPELSHLYDQALVLIVLTREGIWNAGIPINPAAQKAKKLVDFLTSAQKADGHWARTWRSETGQVLADDQWVGDQAWWIMALMEYATKSGDMTTHASAQKGADWLIPQIDPNGKVVPSTEGTVDVWWAMIATRRFNEADKIQNYLLTQVWDADLKYWWRGFGGYPDPFIAVDCATWVGEFAKSPRVNKPEMARAALSFVRRTLVTTDDSGTRCGFDGMGPVSIWCEGTAQYVSAGGEEAQKFLDMLLSLQRDDGGMPGSPDNWSSDCFGWLTSWTGLAPTAWLYFALTQPPFASGSIDRIEPKAQLPNSIILQQNYPNPFLSETKSREAGISSTRIEYFLPKSDRVTLKIYALTGHEIASLVDQLQAAGWHNAIFNGAGLANGIYFYRLQVGKFAQTKKFMLLR
ncbi:MAG: T9SS type A sorting domain-containing protein [candidate division KSB1 bacterium]|nr:T9SS type A sorting domain-containing protein [candidate division KSB1 bacterium]MDZ7305071.1 T9SS type A sorting domain-containing protein [candidate division KSB1 bacterium]